MNGENEVREINFKFMLLYVFRRWRVMLCVALILAVLLGGYEGLNYFKNWDTTQQTHIEAKEDYEKELAVYELQKQQYESQIRNNELDLENQGKYLKESILMKLDYKNKAQANANVFFKLDANTMREYGGVAYDPTDSLISLFFSKLNYNTDWDSIAEKYDTQPKYIQELVRYENQKEGNILTVTVSHSKLDVAEEILDEVIKAINKQAQTFERDTFSYTISIVKNETTFVSDTELFEMQSEAEEIIIKTSDKIGAIKASKSALIMPTLSVGAPSFVSLAKNAIIFAIIGAIVGVIIVAGIYLLIYCLSDKIHSEEEFTEYKGTKLLGRINISGKKRFGNRIDRFVESVFGINSDMTAEQKEKLLVYNIKNTVNSAKNILLIGEAPEGVFSNVKELILKAFKDANVTAERDIIKNVDAYEKISQNDVIIAIEKIGYSRYSGVFKTEGFIETKEKELTGYILV